MRITLCFDFGNTRLKCAVFENDTLITVDVLADANPQTIADLILQHKATHSILSSVVHHDVAIENILQQQTVFHKLDHTSRLPFTTPVGKPETIGADRLALIAAAVQLHPQMHSLVIGLGSCITYNFVNRFHEFLGGGISPGLEMRMKAMNQFTAKLPLIKADWNFPLVGYDTRTNMLSGVILGMAKEIEGIADEYAARYANFNVLLTGGDMAFFAPHFKKKIFADPHLIYKGLYAISKSNS
ncbi:type III pantothenate kinase [Panacibacter sp. DH6]|uniref:Type III pantothenate kinase n=1 Tax=Panacibacter microcysteis TaxID=2793269 RepID=A0A931GX80_9BACT|nr:type III pantothenate kinase [Panacibacter microcysteis]MBG9375179.1 type III pantothenate kinase [Panacibacter microcysteis]